MHYTEIVRKITTWKMAEKEHHENGRPENTRYCNCEKKHTEKWQKIHTRTMTK